MNSAQPVSYLMIHKDFEKPISFSPTLARVFGIEAAIFLQWLHYFMVVKSLQERPLHDGRMWVYNSYEDWHSHMNFLSLTGVTSAIRKMEALGVILSAQMGVNKFDRRKSYTIDYARLSQLTNIPLHAIFAQNGQMEATPKISQPEAAALSIASPVAQTVSATIEPATAPVATVAAEASIPAPAAAIAENTETPMPAERRVLVQRNRRLKSLDEATPDDFERLGLPDLRHIDAGLRPFSYSPVVMGVCPVPSDYYAHVEEVCIKLNVPYVRPDIEPYVSVPSYTDSTTNSSKPDSTPVGSTIFSANATAAAPIPTPPLPQVVADATEKGVQSFEGDFESANFEKPVPEAEIKPVNLDSIVNALCMVCYPGGDVGVQRKTAKIERELTRAAQDIVNQMPDIQPAHFRLWPAFQQVMGWRFLTPGFVVQHWAEYRAYCENPSRFVVRLPNRLKKPDPFTHLRDEFVLDIPED